MEQRKPISIEQFKYKKPTTQTPTPTTSGNNGANAGSGSEYKNSTRREEEKKSGSNSSSLGGVARRGYSLQTSQTTPLNSSASKINTTVVDRTKKATEIYMDKQDDSGANSLSYISKSSDVAIKTIKASQAVSDRLIKEAKKTPKRIEQTYRAGKIAVVTTAKTINSIKKLSEELKNYRIVIKNGKLQLSKRSLIYGNKLVGGKQVKVVKGVLYSSPTIKLSKQDFINLAKKKFSPKGNSNKIGSSKKPNFQRRNMGYSLSSAKFVDVNKIGKALNTGIYGASELVDVGDDFSSQSVSAGLKTIHYTVKAVGYTPEVIKAGYKGGKAVAKGAYKSGKFVKKTAIKTGHFTKTTVKSVKRYGWKKTFKLYKRNWKRNAVKFIKKAGNSVVNSVVNGTVKLITKLGAKVILPLIVCVTLVVGASQLLNAFAGGITTIFSPFLMGENGEVIDESEWLINNISSERRTLIQYIKDIYNSNHISNGGIYHFVRFYDGIDGVEVPLTDENITINIYSVGEYQEYIQPIFHSVMISKYEMQGTEEEMKSLFDEIWDSISSVMKTQLPTEYCNMTRSENEDGTYNITPIYEADGNVYADITGASNGFPCPNHSNIKYHSSNSVGVPYSCDYSYYTCLGHREKVCFQRNHVCVDDCRDGCIVETHICNEECFETNYCSMGEMASPCENSEYHWSCDGYYICGGHNVLKIAVDLKDLGGLLSVYFVDEISALESIVSRTDEQEKRLKELKTNYEICLNYAQVLADAYGVGSGTVVDIGDVELTSLTEYAVGFVGNPYIWGGVDPNIGADCSGFVQYVYSHFGVTLPRTSREQVACGITIHGIENAKAGDLIFLSNSGTDRGVYHVAMYLGDGLIVHASNSAPYPRGGIKISKVYTEFYKIKRVAE